VAIDSRHAAQATRLPRIAVLASGRGSNLQAVLDAIAAGALRAQVVGVFSDRRAAFALQRARDAGIVAQSLAPKSFATRDAFDDALFAQVAAVRPDLVLCAGYMRLLGAAAVDAWRGRMINIHPSLLPAFKGLHTHRQALETAATRHGASIHFVTRDLDGGPVIAQAEVPVLPGDDEDALAARVLAREHPLLVETLRWLADGRIALSGDVVLVDGNDARAPLQLGAKQRFA
jgi:phosphoribosylglycinamide formyltransferase-1